MSERGREGLAQLAVWIPAPLKERLEAAATGSGRSQRDEVIAALSAHLGDAQSPPAEQADPQGA